MKWKWSARGAMFLGREHNEIAQICGQAGFEGIECNHRMFASESEAEIENIRKIYECHGIKMATFHLPDSPYSDDVASFYENERKSAVKKIRAWMLKAGIMGVRTCILHPTTSPFDACGREEVDLYMLQLGKSLTELLPAASDLSCVLALENMLPSISALSRFGALAEHISMIAERFKDSNLGFCYDTGHALIAEKGNALEILRSMNPFPAAFHLQDNAGDRDSHLEPGRGLVNWAEVFRTMDAAGFSGYATIEAPPFAHGPVYSAGAWKTLLDNTKALVKSAKNPSG